MKYLLYFSLIISIFGSCKSKHFTPYEFEGQKVIFGSGGGFSGQVMEYTLLENGQLFAGTNKEGFVDELKRLKKSEVKQLFKNIDQFDFKNISLDAPGNKYSYMIIHDDKANNKIQWGDQNVNPPKELLLVFESLKNYIKIRNLNK